MIETFKNLSAKEQGIDIGRLFEVIKDDNVFKKGEIIKLTEDDGSVYPFFSHIDKDRKNCCYWNHLTYAKVALHSNENKIMKFKAGDKVCYKTDSTITDTVELVPGMERYENRNYGCAEKGFVLKDNGWAHQENWELIKKGIIKNTMQNIQEFVRDLKLSANDKLLRKHGLQDECGKPTELAKEMVCDKAVEDNYDYLVEQATAFDTEEKKEKK